MDVKYHHVFLNFAVDNHLRLKHGFAELLRFSIILAYIDSDVSFQDSVDIIDPFFQLWKTRLCYIVTFALCNSCSVARHL